MVLKALNYSTIALYVQLANRHPLPPFKLFSVCSLASDPEPKVQAQSFCLLRNLIIDNLEEFGKAVSMFCLFFPQYQRETYEKPPPPKHHSPPLFLPHLDVAVEEITTLLSKALTSGTDDTIVLTEILNTMSHLCDGDSSEYRQAST